ncbi:MAG: hypothetical protein QM763_06065 [Agriterribacter sp.]
MKSGVCINTDVPLLPEEDIAEGLAYDCGKITASENAGLGIEVNLQHYRHHHNHCFIKR